MQVGVAGGLVIGAGHNLEISRHVGDAGEVGGVAGRSRLAQDGCVIDAIEQAHAEDLTGTYPNRRRNAGPIAVVAIDEAKLGRHPDGFRARSTESGHQRGPSPADFQELSARGRTPMMPAPKMPLNPSMATQQVQTAGLRRARASSCPLAWMSYRPERPDGDPHDHDPPPKFVTIPTASLSESIKPIFLRIADFREILPLKHVRARRCISGSCASWPTSARDPSRSISGDYSRRELRCHERASERKRPQFQTSRGAIVSYFVSNSPRGHRDYSAASARSISGKSSSRQTSISAPARSSIRASSW